jgi:2,3-bisphosphoglycerate-dependent phosphoglycerate mutase
MNATDVLLVRHGLPESAPSADPPLSATGQGQAAALARWLTAGPERTAITAVYSSPLLRARQTAEPTAAALGFEPAVHAGLREWVDPSQPIYRLPESFAGTPRGTAFDEGRYEEFVPEHDADGLQRQVTAAVREIAAPHAGETIVAATHGGALNSLLAGALQSPRRFFFDPGYGSISRLRVWPDGRLVLVSVNETAHLGHERLAALAAELQEDVA